MPWADLHILKCSTKWRWMISLKILPVPPFKKLRFQHPLDSRLGGPQSCSGSINSCEEKNSSAHISYHTPDICL
jgi:hypothetical protein